MLERLGALPLLDCLPFELGITSNGVVIPMFEHPPPAVLRLLGDELHKGSDLLFSVTLCPVKVSEAAILFNLPKLVEARDGLLPLPDIDLKGPLK